MKEVHVTIVPTRVFKQMEHDRLELIRLKKKPKKTGIGYRA